MLRVGVVGVGHLGQHHVRIFSKMTNCELVGIFDKNIKRAAEIATKFNTRIFKNYQDLLNNIDAIDISATTTYHYDLAKDALLAGKHVFVEKPITAELWQAEELLKIADEKSLKIQVGHIERFNPVMIDSADIIKNPIFIESHRIAPFNTRGSDVPVILDLMIHDIDLILSFIDSKIKNINASGLSLFTNSIDIANARLEFENGAIANVTSSRVALKKERKIRFFQKDAYISANFQDQEISVVKKSKDLESILAKMMIAGGDIKADDLVDTKFIDSSNHEKDALTLELESFVEAIKNNQEPIVNGQAGLRALRIALKIVTLIEGNNKKNKDLL
jgi:predicted dehydrogenase